MQRTIILLNALFYFLVLNGQEDSTVYLKPSYRVGDKLNYKLKYSFVKMQNEQGSFINDNYFLQLDLLKTAFGLGIFKTDYKATGSDYSPGSKTKLKDDLNVFFTIDSNTRFVAIENCHELIDSLNNRSLDGTILSKDSIQCEVFFPEIELLFMLHGAKYVKGVMYEGNTIVPTEWGFLESVIEIEMIEFTRQTDRFRIVCTIKPKELPDQMIDFSYHMDFEFRLSDLILMKVDSKMRYRSEFMEAQKSVVLSSN